MISFVNVEKYIYLKIKTLWKYNWYKWISNLDKNRKL